MCTSKTTTTTAIKRENKASTGVYTIKTLWLCQEFVMVLFHFMCVGYSKLIVFSQIRPLREPMNKNVSLLSITSSWTMAIIFSSSQEISTSTSKYWAFAYNILLQYSTTLLLSQYRTSSHCKATSNMFTPPSTRVETTQIYSLKVFAYVVQCCWWAPESMRKTDLHY